jgi:hypothetical protein
MKSWNANQTRNHQPYRRQPMKCSVRRATTLVCLVFGFWLWGPVGNQVWAQPASPPTRGPVVELEKLNWLMGVWRHIPGEEFEFEQHWSSPVDDSMMGMFRLVSDEKVVVYEFLLLEKLPEGLFLRIRHYRPGMLEVSRFPYRLKLIEESDRQLVFENPDGNHPKRITYRRLGAGRMDVLVESIEEGKATTFQLRFQQPTVTLHDRETLRR